MPQILLFDIGGTNTRIAISRDGRTVGTATVMPTPRTFEEGIEVLTTTAKRLSGDQLITAVSGGLSGPIDRAGKRFLNAPHLTGWKGKPLADRLAKLFKCPVVLENDAALAGLGEATKGAGKGKRIVAFLTVSTGVGGARIVDGAIDVNAWGFEPGYQLLVVEPDAKTLESLVSGSGFEERFGKRPTEIQDERVWEEAARWLAYGITNTIVHWSPDVVVVGGSMIRGLARESIPHTGIPLVRVQEHLRESLTIFPAVPKVVAAALGDRGGLEGALRLAMQYDEGRNEAASKPS